MKKFSIEFKWAIIFAIAALLWMMLEKAVGLHDEYIGHQLIYTNLFGIVAIIIFALALRDKKENYYQGEMNWTQGFLCGAIISIIIAILSPGLQYITFTHLIPGHFDKMIEHSVAIGNKRETAEKIFNMKSYVIQSALGGISMGIVTSAIVALFVRTKKTL